jgi:methylmalonyl-CoA epimerase
VADDSPIAKFLAKNGPGLHHVAYRVADLPATLAALRSAGVRLIDDEPRPGAHGMKIAFAHPKSTGGVLTEFCQQA